MPYLNNMVEQGHRLVKKRIAAGLLFRSFGGALNTIAGYEAIHMIRKGQIRWVAKSDLLGQVAFIERFFGLAARVKGRQHECSLGSDPCLQQSRNGN